MKATDLAIVVRGVVPVVREFIAAQLALVIERIAALERHGPARDGRDGAIGPIGERGEKGDIGAMGPRGERGEPGELGPIGPHGEKGALGERGDVGPRGETGEAGPHGLAGKDGESVTVNDVWPLIAAEVTRSVDFIPRPKDGAPGPPGVAGQDGRDAIEPPSLDPELIASHTDSLLRKAFADLDAAAPPRIVTRVMRDARGRIARVIEEPVTG